MALAIGKVWTDTVADVQRRFGEFALPAAAFVFMPSLLIARFADGKALGEQNAQLAQAVGGLVGVIGQAAIVLLVLFPRIDAGTAIRRAVSLTPRIVLASLAVLVAFIPVAVIYTAGGAQASVLMSVLLLLLTAVAVYVALRLSLLAAIIAAENARAADALRRSWLLTAGNVGRILAVFAAFVLIFVILSALVGAIGLALTGGTPENPSFLTELLISIVGAVFSVFIAVLTANVYRQLAA
ncbi:MAG: glycerophosphoryl diester phosphodiesterase membrane domain-containing protein [Sphingomonadaceae bacterium]|nr:glycerophosphoryl diester phosphodiesterase membrane domain-containing protein [Sphingomonadaceae bacterium]